MANGKIIYFLTDNLFKKYINCEALLRNYNDEVYGEFINLCETSTSQIYVTRLSIGVNVVIDDTTNLSTW